MDKKKEKKGSVILVTVLIVILLVAVGLGSFLAGANYMASKSLEKEKEVKQETATEEKSNVLSDNEALKLGNELWEYAYSSYWGGKPAWKSHEGEVNEAGGKPIVCDTTAEEVKKKYTKDFKYSGETSEIGGLDEFVSEVNCIGAARGADQLYKTTTLAIKKIEENKIVFDAISEYCGSSFCQESKETKKKVIMDFEIVKEQDQWLINSFYLPN